MPKGLVKSLVGLKWCKCIQDAVSMLRIPSSPHILLGHWFSGTAARQLHGLNN